LDWIVTALYLGIEGLQMKDTIHYQIASIIKTHLYKYKIKCLFILC